jgi:hypothetical protein
MTVTRCPSLCRIEKMYRINELIYAIVGTLFLQLYNKQKCDTDENNGLFIHGFDELLLFCPA